MKAEATAAIAVVLGVVVLFGCRSTDPAWYTEPITEQEPFRLILTIPHHDIHHGDTVQATLTLQNTTTRPLMGCFDTHNFSVPTRRTLASSPLATAGA